MILRPFIMFIVITMNLVLQSTLFQYIEIMNIRPNTSLLLIISYAILRGDIEGSIFGFVSGLMQDIFFGRVIGLYALFGLVTGFVCGHPFKNFFRENVIISLVLSIVVTFIYEFVFYVTNFLVMGHLDVEYYMRSVIIPGVVYTTSLSIFVYMGLYAINAKIEAFEKAHRKMF